MHTKLRIVSLVPSWTETLLELGVPVIGRTRFCVHPQHEVAKIPALGGTKQIEWTKLHALKPDYVILDKDENPKGFLQHIPCKALISHVRSLADCEAALLNFADALKMSALENEALRWKKLQQVLPLPPRTLTEIPGIIEWRKSPTTSTLYRRYLIWQNPWMEAGAPTFIESMLTALGFAQSRPPLGQDRYPTLALEAMDPAQNLLLLASEPYPFLRSLEPDSIKEFPRAVIDGEKFSWFGIRARRFLDEQAD